ncbi:MAG: GTPase [Rubripirellula sp.]
MDIASQSAPPARSPQTTVAALITGVGRSAVAVVALQGPDAAAIIGRCFVPATRGDYCPGQIRYGVWRGLPRGDAVDQTPGESVVVTPIVATNFEIHCHGGRAATMRVLADLATAGATEISSSQYSQQASPSRVIAEATEVLARCVTARTAAIAMAAMRGVLCDWASNAMERLNAPSTDSFDDVKQQAAAIHRFAAVTTRLDQPFRVVLVGPPNVGKSSLLNAIVGYDRSITMDIAGTTRDVLHAETVIDGLPIRISDTAGIRVSNEPIEREGITRARAAAGQADLVIRVSEPGLPTSDEVTATALIDVLNKADRLSEAERSVSKKLCTIATTGEGVGELMRQISGSLAGVMPPVDQPVAINDRQAKCVAAIAEATDASLAIELLERLIDFPSADYRGSDD